MDNDSIDRLLGDLGDSEAAPEENPWAGEREPSLAGLKQFMEKFKDMLEGHNKRKEKERFKVRPEWESVRDEMLAAMKAAEKAIHMVELKKKKFWCQVEEDTEIFDSMTFERKTGEIIVWEEE